MKTRLVLLALALLPLLPAQTKSEPRRWDEFFRDAKDSVPVNPSALVLETVANMNPGKALDVGMGNGRNAIWLARRGWKVTGVEPSAEAVKDAQDAAWKAGTAIDARTTRIEAFELGKSEYDLILCMYVQALAVQQAKRLVDALKPGGLLIVEGYQDESAGVAVKPGGPEARGYGDNELLRVFAKLHILRYEDRSMKAEWSNAPDGRAQVVRLVARKG